MTFAPSEITLGAAVPLENGGTISLSISGHVETERDFDDAAVIFGRKLLHLTNCATDADRLTVRQIISSITSTPLDKVPDVGAPTPAPNPEPIPPAPAAKPGEEICERCGCGVSKSQANLSMLFQSKTLCKSCMEAP